MSFWLAAVPATASVVCAWLLADFFTGVFHWWEDRCLRSPSRFAFIERLRLENEGHHSDPTSILKDTYWNNVKESVLFGIPVALALMLIGAPTIAWMTAIFMTLGNLTHRLAHMRKKDLPRVVLLAQKLGLLCSYNQHRRHHYDHGGVVDKDHASRYYCVMTNWLNPVLDRIGFFARLERALGIKA